MEAFIKELELPVLGINIMVGGEQKSQKMKETRSHWTKLNADIEA